MKKVVKVHSVTTIPMIKEIKALVNAGMEICEAFECITTIKPSDIELHYNTPSIERRIFHELIGMEHFLKFHRYDPPLFNTYEILGRLLGENASHSTFLNKSFGYNPSKETIEILCSTCAKDFRDCELEFTDVKEWNSLYPMD